MERHPSHIARKIVAGRRAADIGVFVGHIMSISHVAVTAIIKRQPIAQVDMNLQTLTTFTAPLLSARSVSS